MTRYGFLASLLLLSEYGISVEELLAFFGGQYVWCRKRVGSAVWSSNVYFMVTLVDPSMAVSG